MLGSRGVGHRVEGDERREHIAHTPADQAGRTVYRGGVAAQCVCQLDYVEHPTRGRRVVGWHWVVGWRVVGWPGVI